MKILLVNTNRMKPAVAPIGLDYLSDVLLDAGHEPTLLDLCWTEDVDDEIAGAVAACNPDVIGVTVRNTDDCYFSSGEFFLPGIKEVCDRIREVSDAPLIMGGVGFSVAPAQVLDYCGADYGVRGEGEIGLVRLLDVLESGGPLDSVPNLLFRDCGKIRMNAAQPVALDALPPRTRRHVDNVRYFAEGGQAGVETKRGCSMNCIYCADPVAKGRTVRLRPAKLVVDEMKALLSMGIDHFHTCDCEFNIPPDHAKDVCREIVDAGIAERVRWYAYCSVKPFDAEMADLFKRAGCAGVDFGADSGCDDILRALGRHYSAGDLADTARLCHRFKIPFMYDLLIGGPGETRQSIRRTIDLVRKINADCVGVAMGVRVYDGTPMADLVRSQGDISTNPSIYGAKEDNPGFLKPVFYVSPEVGEGIIAYIHELVNGDSRFFLPSCEEVESNYNYNDNAVLVNAIRSGARGAYWDILRRLR